MNWKYLSLKYSIEFVVIFLGIFLSLHLENNNQLMHQDDLKNQSLSRIISNIETDVTDHKINITKHSLTIEYSDLLIERGEELFQTDKDSLGYYLTALSRSSTTFIDNPEEYYTLRNSGLLEKIKDDELVDELQTKYTLHNYLQEYEKIIRESDIEIEHLVNIHTSSTPVDYVILHSDVLSGKYGTYISERPLNNYELNILSSKANKCYHYLRQSKKMLERDSLLIESIKTEIGLE